MFTSSPPINPSFNFNSFFKSVSQSGNNSMNTSSPSGGSPSNNSQISPIEGNNNSSNNQNHLQSPQDQSNNTNQFMAALASLSNISNQQQQQQQQMKDMSNPFMSGLNNLGMNINPMMMSNPAFFTHLLQNSMGNPMAMNFFQQMFLNNNNNGNNDNKSSSPFNQMNNLKRSYDSISKSPSSPLQSAELLNYMKGKVLSQN
uniref:Uncharacterized protein n=1 Tax=Parastrongyloides trichosuri TaxID=131310 RepID=A0A0N4Z9Z9_PARTI